MTGLELAQRMTATKVTVDELAELMSRRPEEVTRWLASDRPLPKRVTRQLDWLLGLRLIQERMQASGLPACPWIEEHRDPPSDAKDLERYSADIDDHVATCSICQRRTAFAATLPPPLPFPIRLDLGILGNISPWFAWALCGGLVFFFVGALVRGQDVLAENVAKTGLYTALAWVALISIIWLIARLRVGRGA